MVIDASVAIKWFVIEDGRDDALAIIDFKTELVAPELFKAEFTNVLWKKVRRSEVSLEHAKLLIERVETFVTFVPTSFEVGQSALQFAVMLDHPSYDCIYLALAERLGTKLVTADRKFADELDKVGLGHLVMRLGDAKPDELKTPIISDEDLKNVIALSARYNETIGSLYRLLKSSSERFSFVASRDMQPAWQSPDRRRLQAFLGGLSEAELADLVALGWLGRGYDGVDFSALRVNARTALHDGPSNYIAYVTSILQYVEQGLAILHTLRSDE
ncbi:MAG: PIN domain-containing protein [Methylocella sp.]